MELLEVKNVSKSFNIKSGFLNLNSYLFEALKDVSFSLKKGTALGVVGESGSGKTTLGKIITGIFKADSGEVFIDGNILSSYNRPALSEKVQMIFQNPFSSLNPKLSIKTMLKEALPNKTSGKLAKINDTLELAGLKGDILDLYPHQFSGGQRQRIAIARALLKNPKIIIADEPLSSLDISIQNQLINLFLKLKNEFSITFIFISHDFAATSSIADEIIVLKEGVIVESGNSNDVIFKPQNPYTKRLIESVPII